MSFHQQVLDQTQAERRELLSIPIIQDALVAKIARDDYIAFLTQAYHHVRHTVPLLMACGARLPARLEWLRTAGGEYIEKGMGHQRWTRRDREAGRVDPVCGRALAAIDAAQFAARLFNQLSSGEKQRVVLARALILQQQKLRHPTLARAQGQHKASNRHPAPVQ